MQNSFTNDFLTLIILVLCNHLLWQTSQNREHQRAKERTAEPKKVPEQTVILTEQTESGC